MRRIILLLILLTYCTVYTQIPTNGLITSYLFSGTFNDNSGSNNLTKNGNVIFTTDRFGNPNSATLYDGSSYLQSPTNDFLDNATTGSISFWIWADSRALSGTSIFSYSTDATLQSCYNFQLYQNKFVSIVKVSDPWTSSLTTKQNIVSGMWYHICVIADGINNQKAFINGVEDTWGHSGNGNGNEWFAGTYGVKSYAHFMTVGALRRNGNSESGFIGKIDDIRLYNRALTVTEVQALYSEGGWTGATPCPGTPTVTDTRDGFNKVYNTVQIGNQCWLKENLDVGEMIIGTQNQSNNSKLEKYCYNDSIANCAKYGGLYQWDEAMQYVTKEKTQGICPTGWHIPTKSEFDTLSNSVSNSLDALVAVGESTGKDLYGFSALLIGTRSPSDGKFYDKGTNAYFWSSTEYNSSSTYDMLLDYYKNSVYLNNGTKSYGISVRCIKDDGGGTTSTQGYWKMDETTGNTVADFSGKNNNGTAISSASIVQGLIGNARLIPVVSNVQAITIPNSTSLNLTGTAPFTLESIVKIIEYDGGGLGFVNKQGNYALFTGSYGSTGYLQFFIYKDAATGLILQSDNQLPKNKWIHIAGTWDGVTAKLYIDYQLVKSQAYSTPMSGSTDPIILGQRSVDVTTGSTSYIDETRISSSALQPSEFLNSTAPTDPQVLITINLKKKDGSAAKNARISIFYTNGIDLDKNGVDDSCMSVSMIVGDDGVGKFYIPKNRDLSAFIYLVNYEPEVVTYRNIDVDQTMNVTLKDEGDSYTKEFDVISPFINNYINIQSNQNKSLGKNISFKGSFLDKMSISPNAKLISIDDSLNSLKNYQKPPYTMLTIAMPIKDETTLKIKPIVLTSAKQNINWLKVFNQLLDLAIKFAKLEEFITVPGPLMNPFTVMNKPTVTVNGNVYDGVEIVNVPILRICRQTNCTDYASYSSIDNLVIDEQGRMTGSYYQNGIYIGDKNEIPGTYYSGHLSHPNIIHFETPASSKNKIILNPTAPGAYTFQIQNTTLDNSYYASTSSTANNSQILINMPLPDASTSPIAKIKIDASIKTSVKLSAEESTDPKNSPLTFEWYESDQLLSTSIILEMKFTQGYHVVRLNAKNTYGISSSATFSFFIDENLNHIDKNDKVLSDFSLMQNYPNPFNPTTTIEFQVPAQTKVKINIYDVNGQLIKELMNEEKNAGKYSIIWNGKNNSGSTVASGTYFYQIQSGHFILARKMIFLK